MATSRIGTFALTLGIIVAAALVGLFVAFGPPKLLAKTSTPEFCGSCHVMSAQYEAWFHHGAHKRAACVDCHLPNDTYARHLFWKTLDGVHDLVRFQTGQVSDDQRLTARGARVVQENCQRCHAEIMARVSADRPCWSCHRRLSHRLSGAMASP
jgi:cytochrome c nitrite reductase small subunit